MTAYVYVGGNSSLISIAALDLQTGGLIPKPPATAGASAMSLAFAPGRKVLYAVDDTATSVIIAFTINGGDGALTEINREATGGDGAAHIVVHPTGKWVMVAHFNSGDVTVHPVRADGGIGKPSDTKMAGMGAHESVFDHSGNHVMVPCRDSMHVAQFKFQAGVLVANTPPAVPLGGGPRHMAFDAHDRFAYVLMENNSTVSSYRYDKVAGTMSDPQTLPTTAPGLEGASAQIVVHPSGKFLYVSNRSDSSIVAFSIDPSTGRLENRSTTKDTINWPRGFDIDPTGRYLVVANQNADSILVFRIDPVTGCLTRVGVPLAVGSGPTFVGVLSLP